MCGIEAEEQGHSLLPATAGGGADVNTVTSVSAMKEILCGLSQRLTCATPLRLVTCGYGTLGRAGS
jgi:hypothetical protein